MSFVFAQPLYSNRPWPDYGQQPTCTQCSKHFSKKTRIMNVKECSNGTCLGHWEYIHPSNPFQSGTSTNSVDFRLQIQNQYAKSMPSVNRPPYHSNSSIEARELFVRLSWHTICKKGKGPVSKSRKDQRPPAREHELPRTPLAQDSPVAAQAAHSR